MRVPNSNGIYAPSRQSLPKKISVGDFEKNTSVNIQVSFSRDGISNPQTMTAYGYGLDCWYLAEFK